VSDPRCIVGWTSLDRARKGIDRGRQVRRYTGWYYGGPSRAKGAVMTAIASRRNAQVHMVTAKEARKEIKSLLARVRMSRDELEKRGNAWELDAEQRGVLADIRGLEFLIERAAAEK
jgi:hypothetical protein